MLAGLVGNPVSEILGLNEKKLGTAFFLEEINENLVKLIDLIEPSKSKYKELVVLPEMKLLLGSLIQVAMYRDQRSTSFNFLTDSFNTNLDNDGKGSMIFLIPPEIPVVDKAIDIIQKLISQKFRANIYLVFYPQATFMIKYHLKRIDCKGIKRIYDFNFDLIPFASDLVTLEYKPSIKEIFVTGEYMCHNLAAESIFRLFNVFGKFKSIFIKGKHSEITFNIFKSLQRDNARKFASMPQGKFRILIRSN